MLIFYSDNHYYEKFEDGTINDITEEIPFDIPKSWNICRLNMIASLDNGIKIKNKKLPYLEAKYLRGKTSPTYLDNGIEVFPNEFLILVDGENSGEVFINKENGYMGSTFKILNISQNMNYEYIIFILRYFQNYLKNSKKGAAIPHLNKELFKNLLITIPPFSEQERIVNKLKELELIINKYNFAYSKLENLNNSYKNELKKSILQYAIQGKLVKQDPNDEPAEILINKILNEKRELIKTKQIKKENLSVIYKDPTDNQFYEKFDDGKIVNITEEIPFEIPDSWRWIKLKTIAFVTKLAGFEYTKNIFPNLTKSGIPLFKGKNVQNGKLVLDFESYIPEQVSTDLPRSQLTKKCLLTPYVGTIGNIAIFDGSFKAHLGSNVGKIELYGNILEEYILYYLRSYTGNCELKKFKKATAQESISIDALRECYIALPPLNEQNRIVEKIKNIFEYIETAE